MSFDTVSENREFAEKFSFPFDLLSDVDRRVAIAYAAATSPGDEYAKRISYLIDAAGRIQHVWEKVDPKQHAAEALKLL